MDADQFWHILTSTNHKKENKDLRYQIAILSRKLASENIDPNSLEAYITWRMTPLDKNPCVRPIGVSEVLRQIIGKNTVWVLKDYEVAGFLQNGTELQSVAEAAIHAMKNIWKTMKLEL